MRVGFFFRFPLCTSHVISLIPRLTLLRNCVIACAHAGRIRRRRRARRRRRWSSTCTSTKTKAVLSSPQPGRRRTRFVEEMKGGGRCLFDVVAHVDPPKCCLQRIPPPLPSPPLIGCRRRTRRRARRRTRRRRRARSDDGPVIDCQLPGMCLLRKNYYYKRPTHPASTSPPLCTSRLRRCKLMPPTSPASLPRSSTPSRRGSCLLTPFYFFSPTSAFLVSPPLFPNSFPFSILFDVAFGVHWRRSLRVARSGKNGKKKGGRVRVRFGYGRKPSIICLKYRWPLGYRVLQAAH